MDGSRRSLMWNSLSQCKDSGVVDLGSSNLVDTALCLNSYCVMAPNIDHLGPSKNNRIDESLSSKDEISLALRLGHSGSHLQTKSNYAAAAAATALIPERDVEEQSQLDMCLDFDLNFGSKRTWQEVINTSPSLGGSERERPEIDLELNLSTAGASESDVTSVTLASSPIQSSVDITTSSDIVQLVDEGSTSSKWKKCSIAPLLDGLPTTVEGVPLDGHSNSVNPVSVVSSVPTIGPIEPPKSLDVAGTFYTRPPRKSAVKTCQFPGCQKGARGASGHCISHGGGRRCQKPGCQKGAEGKTAFCKAHGGGRRCEHLGCTKSAEGRTNFCISHGGGRRCTFQGGCTRAARGKSGLCIRHGGGKRCKIENCTKSAEGLAGLCIAHGGGRRCQYPQCTKGAQGSTKFCKAHGGGKRCTFLGCTKGAEGSTPFCKAHGGGKRCSFQGGGVCTKSVHGGTSFCVSHGGGKRCAVAGCTRSARGRTSCCVRHGGGKRCKSGGCGKSAQGSTDFCKAHGGGKRCLWGKPGSGFGGASDNPCDKFARGKIGLCAAHAAQVQDKRVHGDGTVGLKLKEAVVNNPVDEGNSAAWHSFDFGGHSHNSTPMQIVIPSNQLVIGECGGSSTFSSLPEGRVHGGRLMAMLRAGVVFGAEGASLE